MQPAAAARRRTTGATLHPRRHVGSKHSAAVVQRACRGEKHNELYNIDTWASQTRDFIQEQVGEPVFLVGHSLGALVCLQVSAAWVHCL